VRPADELLQATPVFVLSCWVASRCWFDGVFVLVCGNCLPAGGFSQVAAVVV